MTVMKTRAQVAKIAPLTDSIMRLQLIPEHYIDYRAGQYLQINGLEQDLSYSIANAPLGSHYYELHVRHAADNASTKSLFAHIKKAGWVDISIAYGNCCLDVLAADKPILFLAGGTGFAPIQAMIEQLLANSDQRSFELFWAARSQSDLYFSEKVTHWQHHVRHFNYFSLLYQESRDTLARYVLEKHQHDLNDWQVVLSGPFDMVYRTRDLLVAQGFARHHLFSDAFDFET